MNTNFDLETMSSEQDLLFKDYLKELQELVQSSRDTLDSVMKDVEKILIPSMQQIKENAYIAKISLERATAQLLSTIDILKFNEQVEYFYQNLPKDIETNIDEKTIEAAKTVAHAIEEFNTNPNAIEKVKIPFCETNFIKNLRAYLSLLASIVSILFYAGYNVKEDFIEPFITSIEITNTTNIEE